MDGSFGIVHADPDQATCNEIETRISKALQEKQALDACRSITPRRADGTIIEVAANMGALEEIDVALEAGAMGSDFSVPNFSS